MGPIASFLAIEYWVSNQVTPPSAQLALLVYLSVRAIACTPFGESEIELPTVKSITATADERLPTMLTMDATGRILEQHGNILRPTDGFCMIVPATEVTLEMKDKQIACHKEAVTSRPKWFIGWPVHKRFEEWKGVCRGYVKSR